MDPFTLAFIAVSTWLVDRDYKAAQKREAHDNQHCAGCGWLNKNCTCKTEVN